jgi:uncharacterized protein (TIGR00251 family)
MSAFFRETGDGISLSVRLTPRSSADAIEGVETTADGRAHLKARVRAVPEDGKANKALEKLVAKALRLPPRDVAVTAGTTSRLKTLAIAGDPAELSKALLALAGRS